MSLVPGGGREVLRVRRQGRQFSVTADFDGEKTSLFKRVSGGKSQNLGRAGGNDPCSRQPTYARTELSAD